MKRNILYGILVLLLLSSCTFVKNPETKTPENKAVVKNVENNIESKKDVINPSLNEAPIDDSENLIPLDQNKNIKLFSSIKEIIKKDLSADVGEEEFTGIWNDAVERQKIYQINIYPKTYKNMVFVCIYFNVYLFGYNDITNISLLGNIGDGVIINTAKLIVNVEKNKIELWSQKPYSAANVGSTLEWDGKNLKIISRTVNDDTVDYYKKMREFLEKGDIDSMQKLDDGPMYPSFYQDYYELPRPIIKLAHKKALEYYNKGNIKKAIETFDFGIGYYSSVYFIGDFLSESKDNFISKQDNYNEQYKLSIDEITWIFNDYGFLLSESGNNEEAEKYLKKVIKINPKRVVAYLNLGDVYWTLNKKDDAKKCYLNYIKILGKDNKIIPKRVLERIK